MALAAINESIGFSKKPDRFFPGAKASGNLRYFGADRDRSFAKSRANDRYAGAQTRPAGPYRQQLHPV